RPENDWARSSADWMHRGVRPRTRRPRRVRPIGVHSGPLRRRERPESLRGQTWVAPASPSYSITGVRLTQTYLARCPRGQPPPAPLPSPTARPNKGVLTICSSGCAAFGHPASPPKDRSPTRDGRECRGQIWFAASHGCGAHGLVEADVLVDTTGVAGGTCRAQRRAGLTFKSRYAGVEDRQPKEPAAALAERCRPVTGQRSCYDRAPKT